eukprot:GHUV01022609.1.p3 GENE.GHUV01022609.1~~GHUV01022609.1.p3  ORF type:complete len:108 (-),score=20.19 GHUV01022609.1:1213-1536(-)
MQEGRHVKCAVTRSRLLATCRVNSTCNVADRMPHQLETTGIEELRAEWQRTVAREHAYGNMMFLLSTALVLPCLLPGFLNTRAQSSILLYRQPQGNYVMTTSSNPNA